MQYSLQELTDKLLKALDKDNNVVDMPGVLAVLAVLEDYPVTKESLGNTRVGKYVNEMRRKTNDKDLSRRAKNLVRRWKQLVDGAGGNNSGPVNGEGIASKGTGGPSIPHLPAHLTQGNVSKPSSPGSRPATPSSGKSTQSPNLPSRVSRPDTPGAVSRPSTPSSSVHSPGLHISRPATPGAVDSPLARGKNDATATTTSTPQQPTSRANQQQLAGRLGPVATSTPVQQPGSGVSMSDSLSKTNAANKKRRRENDSSNTIPSKRLQLAGDTPEGTESKGKGPRNGLMSSRVSSLGPDSPGLCDNKVPGTPPAVNSGRPQRTLNISSTPGLSAADRLQQQRERKAVSRTSKVKTTAELIQEMRLDSSEVTVRIAHNQIEKESDPLDVSIVPAGAKPRPRRKPGTVIPPNTSERTLIQTKTEMMEKFLTNSYNMSGDQFGRTTPSPYSKSDPPSRTHSPCMLDQAGYSGFSARNNNNGSLNSSSGDNNEGDSHPVTFFTDDNKIRQAGELDENGEASTKPVIDPWSLLPPLLHESEIDWSEEEPYEPPDITVTDSDIERLHEEKWAGVNGQYGKNGEWVDWTQGCSLPTYNGDTLHILPYVDLSD